MSLLLDALKKAELAKQLAKAGAEKTASAEPEAPATTREALRDVTPPLELMTDEPAYPEQGPAASSVRPELSFQQPDLAAAGPDAPRYAAETAGEAERAQARQLFEVKEMDYNPRRPFYISLAVLGLVGAGYAGYVWWETRPKYAAVASIPPASPPVAAVAPPPVPAMPPPSKEASVAPGAAPASPPPAPEAAKKVQEIPPIQPVRPPRTRRQTQRAAAAPAPRRPFP